MSKKLPRGYPNHILPGRLNPYWQITETKSKTWEFTERHLRKQNPKNFQKFYFGNVTERHLWKQNPNKNTEYLVIIFVFSEIFGFITERQLRKQNPVEFYVRINHND